MKRKLQSVFSFGLLWLFVLTLFTTALSVNTPRKVAAAPDAYSTFCQPPTTLDNGVGWRPNGWLSLEIVNRAQIKITIVPTGNCANQNRTMDSVVGESPGKMKALLEEVLMDNNISDDTWGYRSFVDGFSGDGVRDQTFMDYFRDGDVGSATSDPFGGNNMFVPNLSSSFGGWTDEAQLVFGVEPNVFGSTMGSDNPVVGAALAYTSLSCDDGGNIALFDYESQFQWGCTSRTRDRKGLIVGGTFKNIENFNIVWIASPDGSKLTHVSKDLEGSQSFTWCGAENFTQPNGEKGRYRTNCASSTSGYYLEGPNANPKTMTEKASESLIGITVRKEGDSNPGYAASVAGASSEAAGASTAGGAGTGAVGSVDGDVEPSCETTSGFNLSWVLCPIINGLTTMSQGIFSSVIEPYLKTQPISAENTPENVTFKIWASFRTLGNIVLVFGLLFIVFGQSIGGGMLDAYTAKKAMPRILVAAILINLSIYLVAFMIDIANVLGAGIGMLITSPLRASDQYNFTIGGGTAGTLGAIAGVSALGIWLFEKIRNPAAPGAAWGPPATDRLLPPPGVAADPTAAASSGGSFMPFFLLFVLLPIALITLAIFATLIIRRGLIMFLVIVSPVAIALYTLPQTEKYAKKWFESLMKTLMVYPIIVAIFSIAYVLSLTIIAANGGADEGTFSQFLAKIIGLIVLFVPLAMIPFAFKLAGGALASLYGALNGFGKKSVEAIKGNAHDPTSLRNQAKKDAVGKLNRQRANFYRRTLRDAPVGSSAYTRGRTALSRRIGGLVGSGGGIIAKEAELNEEAKKRLSAIKDNGDDTLLRASMSRALYVAADGSHTTDIGQARMVNGQAVRATDSDGQMLRRTLGGKEVTEAQYRDGSRLHNTLAERQYAMYYEHTKAANMQQRAHFKENLPAWLRENGYNEGESAAAFLATAFGRQGESLIKYDKMGGAGWLAYNDAKMNMDDQGRAGKNDERVDDMYYKRGPYQHGMLGADDIDAVYKVRDAYAEQIRTLSQPIARDAGDTDESFALKQQARTRKLQNAKDKLSKVQSMEKTWLGSGGRIPGQMQDAESGTPAYSGLSGANQGVQDAVQQNAYGVDDAGRRYRRTYNEASGQEERVYNDAPRTAQQQGPRLWTPDQGPGGVDSRDLPRR